MLFRSSQVPAAVVLSPNATTFASLGESVLVSSQVQDAKGNRIIFATTTWSSSDNTVASVDGSGVVTAVKNGSATISATSLSAVGRITVNVSQAIKSIETTPSVTATLKLGGTLQCLAVGRDARNNFVPDSKIAWISLTPDLASVSPDGVVVARAEGAAIIAASAAGASRSITLYISR